MRNNTIKMISKVNTIGNKVVGKVADTVVMASPVIRDMSRCIKAIADNKTDVKAEVKSAMESLGIGQLMDDFNRLEQGYAGDKEEIFEQLKTLTRDLRDSEDNIEDIDSRISYAEDRIDDITRDIESAEDRIGELESQVSDICEYDWETTEERLNDLVTEVYTADTKFCELHNDLEARITAIEEKLQKIADALVD